MTDTTLLQCNLMGDVLFRDGGLVSWSVTYAGPTTYTWSTTLRAGSWFANPLVFWQYVINSWNLAAAPGGLGVMEAAVDTDPDSANYGKVLITPDTSWGSIVAAGPSVNDDTVWPDVGLDDPTWDDPSATPWYLPVAIPHILTPIWPPVVYNRSVENLTGGTTMAHDGTLYSVAGSFRERRQLSLAIDRNSNNYDEIDRLILLWKERWCRGRSVSFYLDRNNMPTNYSATMSGGDNLVLIANQARIDFDRTVEYKEVQDKMREVEFGLRVGIPATLQNQSEFVLV